MTVLQVIDSSSGTDRSSTNYDAIQSERSQCMLKTLAHAMRSGHIKSVRSKMGDAMNTLGSIFRRTIVPAVVVLTLGAAVANAQSTSIWLEAECASVGSLWNKPADANASNSSYVVIQPGNNKTRPRPANLFRQSRLHLGIHCSQLLPKMRDEPLNIRR